MDVQIKVSLQVLLELDVWAAAACPLLNLAVAVWRRRLLNIMDEQVEAPLRPRLHDIVQLVDVLLPNVLQVLRGPLRLGTRVQPWMSDHECVSGAGASQVARQSDLHMLGADAIQAEVGQDLLIRQERVHDKLKRPHDAANGAADHHDHLSIGEADPCFCAILNLAPKQKQNASCKAGEEPLMPDQRGQMPRPRSC